MSILDRVTSHLPNLFGKGPPGLPAPHNMSWGINHDRAHGGQGQRGFPGAPGPGGGMGPGMQHGGPGMGNGPPFPPGLSGPPGPPGMPGPPGLSGPPGLANIDRPNGNGWAQGPERPGGQPPGGPGLDRPGGGPIQGHGVDRPQLPGPGQLIRDLLGAPRQPTPAVQGQVQVIQVPGPNAPAQQAAPQGPAMAAQANTAASGPGQALPPPAQMPAAAAPRADAAAMAPQRAEAAPQALYAAAAMRADASVAPRPQDAAVPGLQRSVIASGSTTAPGTTTSAAASVAASVAASTTGPASTAAASAVAGSTSAAAPAAPAPVNVAGNTAASGPLAAAQAAEARNVHNPMAVNDRAAQPRPDAAGYTGEGPQRRGLDRNARTLPGGLSTLLLALGVQGHTGASGRDPAIIERELREAMMQWLFWLLAVVAYGCLGFAIVALLPVGRETLGETSRSWTGGSALVGLFTAVAAWWVARKLGPRRD